MKHRDALSEIERMLVQNDKMKNQLEKIAAFEVHPYTAAKAVLDEINNESQKIIAIKNEPWDLDSLAGTEEEEK